MGCGASAPAKDAPAEPAPVKADAEPAPVKAADPAQEPIKPVEEPAPPDGSVEPPLAEPAPEVAALAAAVLAMDTATLKAAYFGLSGADGQANKEEITAWLPEAGLEIEVTSAAAAALASDLLSKADVDLDEKLSWGEFRMGLKMLAASG